MAAERSGVTGLAGAVVVMGALLTELRGVDVFTGAVLTGAVLTGAVLTGVGEATALGGVTSTGLVGVTATGTEVGLGVAIDEVGAAAAVTTVPLRTGEVGTAGVTAGADVGAGVATTGATGTLAITGATRAATGSGRAARALEGRPMAVGGEGDAGCAVVTAAPGAVVSAKAALARQAPKASTTKMDSSIAAAMEAALAGLISG